MSDRRAERAGGPGGGGGCRRRDAVRGGGELIPEAFREGSARGVPVALVVGFFAVAVLVQGAA